jgi:ribonuclease D
LTVTDDPNPSSAADTDAAASPTVDAAETERPDPQEVTVLREPTGGLPAVLADRGGLADAIGSLAAGTGPVAIDAERAHGFRYTQRAYLIQLRRRESGTFLIDPVALDPTTGRSGKSGSTRTRSESGEQAGPADLGELSAAITDAEWVIHAAAQDLPSLAELDLVPQTLFDTELAGRLLGYRRVNLGTLVEENFQVRLLKEHSAADWSTRPLPTEWLNYAALDVELLLELRDALAAQLEDAGKAEWARQEFAWLAAGARQPPAPRQDPWRRTSGIHRVRNRRGLAVVAELWSARDSIARRTDRAPGRILPDAAITELAAVRHPDRSTLRELPGFRRRAARRYLTSWQTALDRALELADSDLPAVHRASDGPPQQARAWASRDPVAAARLKRARSALSSRAGELELPTENLLTPDHLRRLAWRPPQPTDEQSVDRMLSELGARRWQREIVVPLITPALVADATD